MPPVQFHALNACFFSAHVIAEVIFFDFCGVEKQFRFDKNIYPVRILRCEDQLCLSEPYQLSQDRTCSAAVSFVLGKDLLPVSGMLHSFRASDALFFRLRFLPCAEAVSDQFVRRSVSGGFSAVDSYRMLRSVCTERVPRVPFGAFPQGKLSDGRHFFFQV